MKFNKLAAMVLVSVAAAASVGRPTSMQEALSGAGAEALEFHQHVTTLSDPFFEGRSADTRGGRLAAEYVAFHLKAIGLEPAFAVSAGASGERTPANVEGFLQPFSVPGDVQVKTAEASFSVDEKARVLEVEKDFNPLVYSGKGAARGPLVFVGYSIEEGPNGYSSYKAGDDLKGKIAVVLRYEPVNEKGESRWSNFDGWSRHAEWMPKMAAAVSRGAEGVILVNPPGVKDPRSRTLETVKSTRFGKPIGVPAVMLSADRAKELLKTADTEGRGIMDLRKIADEGGHGALAMKVSAVFSMEVDVDRAKMDSNNIGAVLKGKGDLSGEYVVIGAHYDHLGYGYVGGSNPNDQGKLHPGADDNASGTVGLIMLAKRLKARYDAMGEGESARSVLFLGFGGEEMGLLGSEHFIKNTPIDSTKVVAMLNMDMIGRVKNDEVEVSGMGTAEEFPALLGPVFERSGLKVSQVKSGIGPSDHATFHKAGSPVLAFFSGLHRDYHKPSDTAEKINVEGALRVVSLAEECAWVLAGRREALTVKQTVGTQSGPGRGNARVRLGVMPGDYSGEEPGVMVGDVMENTPAQKAAILKGDRIIRWGGEELADAGAMMQRLRDHKPGDVVEIVVVRDGKEVTIPVTLQSRGGSE
ncbi:MAG: M28 family peptidase [Phycisphaerae bacterium]|nr:M28 family peptidase [Phycisphaerae bacterium]